MLNVGLDERGVSAEAAKLGRKLLAGVLVAAGNDESGAFRRESESGRAADAGQRTCDQDNGGAHGSSPSCYGVGPKMRSPDGLKNMPQFQTYRPRVSEMQLRGWTVCDR